ncbi:MAG TPA: PTS sugar transporter, partial [Clostridia bacterium]|nr:PTS sugar transporter [Clostridia bacterium]
MKKIAILGSSGGNLYNLGGKDPYKLLGEIKLQCQAANIEVGGVVFIGANASMDAVTKETTAALYTLSEG